MGTAARLRFLAASFLIGRVNGRIVDESTFNSGVYTGIKTPFARLAPMSRGEFANS